MSNTIITDRYLLLVFGPDTPDTLHLKQHFCGRVIDKMSEVTSTHILYLGGGFDEKILSPCVAPYYIIREISPTYNGDRKINLGCVPLNIHNQGVFFPQVFADQEYFHLLTQAHEFHTLTESNKPSAAFRKGLYLSAVTDTEQGLAYHLLRCSSNLQGPTDNFRAVDKSILARVTDLAQPLFQQSFTLNHVLAQIYYNDQGKAKIKAHSDKTKDMPLEGLIIFCTFYDRSFPSSHTDRFDQCYRTTSVLTKLHFRRKSCITDTSLVKEFTVLLYPGSVFVIPLSTNRNYTHEIKPSVLPEDKIPTRLGYVIRCSNTLAWYREGQTYINVEGKEQALRQPTPEEVQALRDLYFRENTSAEVITYPPTYFSMNSGDYLAPRL